jgi:hypothetical protein
MFMDREDILNLYIVSNVPLPTRVGEEEFVAIDDDIPF